MWRCEIFLNGLRPGISWVIGFNMSIHRTVRILPQYYNTTQHIIWLLVHICKYNATRFNMYISYMNFKNKEIYRLFDDFLFKLNWFKLILHRSTHVTFCSEVILMLQTNRLLKSRSHPHVISNQGVSSRALIGKCFEPTLDEYTHRLLSENNDWFSYTYYIIHITL